MSLEFIVWGGEGGGGDGGENNVEKARRRRQTAEQFNLKFSRHYKVVRIITLLTNK